MKMKLAALMTFLGLRYNHGNHIRRKGVQALKGISALLLMESLDITTTRTTTVHGMYHSSSLRQSKIHEIPSHIQNRRAQLTTKRNLLQTLAGLMLASTLSTSSFLVMLELASKFLWTQSANVSGFQAGKKNTRLSTTFSIHSQSRLTDLETLSVKATPSAEYNLSDEM